MMHNADGGTGCRDMMMKLRWRDVVMMLLMKLGAGAGFGAARG